MENKDMVTISGLATIARAKTENNSFLSEDDVDRIAKDPETRLTLLLVRCGGGRFLSPADQVAHFISLIEQAGSKDRALANIHGLENCDGYTQRDGPGGITGGEWIGPRLSSVKSFIESLKSDYVRDVSLASNVEGGF